MNLEVKLFKDNEVLELLNDKTFIAQWKELANQNQKVTVIQEPPFVTTWYHQYSNKYQPILILGFDNDNKMVGLIPLALSIEDHYLTHAGHGQAEYHGWLCKKSFDQHFPIQALIAIKHSFQLKKWQWHWVPPGSQINWLTSGALKKENIYVRIVKHDSPILDLSDENTIARLQNNRSLKTKVNRLKKRGGFYLERIKSKERAKEIFDTLSSQCDFRQMASHQTAPFSSDGNKKQFYIERMNYPENNHFTVLWSDNIPIAFHFGACDLNTVILGLTSYNPLEERNSPGSILMIKLIELLREEGYHYFDLTPGEEKYKHNHCNFHQKLYMPTICFGKKEKIISDFEYFTKKAIQACLIFAGITPGVFKNRLNNHVALLKKNPKATLLKILKQSFSIIYKKGTYTYYKLSIDDISLIDFQNNNSINVNNYSDLLLYNDSNPWLQKTDLLSRALKHFASGETLFTIVKNKELLLYGWMNNGKQQFRFNGVDTAPALPEDSIILYDFFIDQNSPDKQGLYTKTLEKMIIECKRSDHKEIFLVASENNIPSGSVIEEIGFTVYRNFRKTKFLGLTHMKGYS